VKTKSLLILILLGVAVCFGHQVRADTISLFNTGVDSGGTPLPGGSIDPHWSIVAGPSTGAAFVLNNPLVGIYAQSSVSSWIWVNANGFGDVNGANYTFRLTFDLTGFNPASASLSGSWGVDNNGSIMLNGSAAIGTGALSLTGGNTGNFNIFHDFSITGGFVAGINTLDFVAENDGGPGGLNVTNLMGTATATGTPDAGSTLPLLGFALAGLGILRRKLRC
jgi:VPDSG-CTERM motif